MRRFPLLALLSALISVPAQAADVLYGMDAPGNLFTIDVETGAGTLVGVLPDGPYAEPEAPPGYNEIEYDASSGRAWAQQRNGHLAIQEVQIASGGGIGAPIPNSAAWHGLEYVGGILYAAGFGGDPEIPSLAVLDPATGNSTVIGPFGLQAGVITGLAWETSTGTLFGIDGGGGGGGVANSTLYTIDLGTGSATPVGATGMKAGSLEFGPDGDLYAGGVGENGGDLYRIDTITGLGAFVGATGFGLGEMGDGISGLTLVSDPIVIPGEPGLFGIDAPGKLFTIDVATGAGTLVGVLPDGPYAEPEAPAGYNEIEYDASSGRAWAQQRNGNFAAQQFDMGSGAGIGGPVPNGASWHGLEYVDGILYAAGFGGVPDDPSLAILDPATGLSSVIGPFGFTERAMTGLAYDPATETMYGIDGGGGEGGPAASTLYRIDLSTGTATPVGTTGMQAGSLEFGPDENLYAGGVGGDRGDLFRLDTITGLGTLVGATGFGVGGMGNGISGLTLVPEPSHPLLFALATLGLMARRRR